MITRIRVMISEIESKNGMRASPESGAAYPESNRVGYFAGSNRRRHLGGGAGCAAATPG